MLKTSESFKILHHSNGSATLVDLENEQAMHSRIGPRLESSLVYADRARIDKVLTAESSAIVLYDVGLGTGSNVTAVLDQIERSPSSKGKLSVFSFETKPEGAQLAIDSLDCFPELRNWAAPMQTLLDHGVVEIEVGHVRVVWTLIVGDFYQYLEPLPVPDFIFFDFYSPKIVPELWSFEKFCQLRAKLGSHPSRLFTYSAATPVRLHLLAAGFYVGAGASTGVKNETTLAATQYELLEYPISQSWLKKLKTSESIRGERFQLARENAQKSPQWLRRSRED